MKQYIYLAFTCIAMNFFLACSGSIEDADNSSQSSKGSVDISIRTSTADGFESPVKEYDDLTGYLFVDNILNKEIPIAGDNLLVFVDKKKTNKLFVVANATHFKKLAALEIGKSDIASFVSAKTEASMLDGGAKMFMSASLDINVDDTKRNIDLIRGVARLDVSVADAGLLISAIRVKNTAKEASLFPGSLSSSTTAYTKTIATPTDQAMPGLLYLYEHSNVKNCTVEIDAIWKGQTLTAKAILPETIIRNKIYKVTVKGMVGALDCSISIVEWGAGGTVDAIPDSSAAILLDPATTELPSTVVADYESSTITAPGDGSTFTFGLTSDFTIEVTPEGNAPFIQIARIAGEKNRFKVTIDPQPWNADAYSMRYSLKNTLLENTYDYLTIQVKDRPYDIPTVTLGGLEWMAFNSLGTNGLTQTRVSAGQSIEEVYQTRFADAMGYYIHWGRPHVFKPWENTEPNTGGGNMWRDSVTCPPRFRVPTIADYKKIFPAGTTIPSTYTVNGKSFRTSVVTPATKTVLPPPSGSTIEGRYLVIEEVSTGHKLFLPFSGYKGDKNSGTGWNMGTQLWLWVLDTGPSGGWAQVFQVLDGNAPKAAYASLQMDGFATLRCVKK